MLSDKPTKVLSATENTHVRNSSGRHSQPNLTPWFYPNLHTVLFFLSPQRIGSFQEAGPPLFYLLVGEADL